MRYLSVCAGIEAATAAWHPLGWQAAAFSEIEAFPRAVLAHHYPEVPLHGDFTTIGADDYGAIDLLVGGTPCQSFSIAGLRGGLDDDRGNLALEFLRLADRKRPRWLVWENVPGVLSIDEGRAFGSILGGMGELGYGFAYRILDAQHFGVPQRRRRVFAVGYLGDRRRAAAVLFERHSLSGNPAPRREKGQVAPTIPSRSLGGGGLGTESDCDGGLIHADDVAHCLQTTCDDYSRADGFNMVAHSLRGEGFDASEDGTGRGMPLAPVAYPINPNALRGDSHAVTPSRDASGKVRLRDPGLGVGADGDPADTLQAAGPGAVAYSIMPMNSGKDYKARETEVAQPLMAGGPVGGNQGGDFVLGFQSSQSGIREVDTHATLDANMGSRRHNGVTIGSAVRRLTPRECERLQGFPDDYTLIPYRGKPAADGPRYKALGNSMAVPVMRWIGERIAAVDAIAQEAKAA
jgi:DNA (cytosine-5)-methyltransferase 1